MKLTWTQKRVTGACWCWGILEASMHLGMLTGTSDSYLSLLTSRRETAPFGSKFLRSVDFLLTIKIWGNPVSLGPDRHYLFLNAWPPAYTLPHSLTPQPPDSGSLPQHVMAGKASAPLMFFQLFQKRPVSTKDPAENPDLPHPPMAAWVSPWSSHLKRLPASSLEQYPSIWGSPPWHYELKMSPKAHEKGLSAEDLWRNIY